MSCMPKLGVLGLSRLFGTIFHADSLGSHQGLGRPLEPLVSCMSKFDIWGYSGSFGNISMQTSQGALQGLDPR